MGDVRDCIAVLATPADEFLRLLLRLATRGIFSDNVALISLTKNFAMSTFVDQFEKAKNAAGFIAALDQSGGSTPKALALYGVAEDSYSGEAEMFTAVHAMRTRIITNSAFAGDKILGAILFENTMRSEISGKPTARFLWEEKNIIPIIKVDQGLADEADGVQLMKPMPKLQSLLTDAADDNVFATKMRSVIKSLNVGGIKELVAQQFAVGTEIIARGLVPIIEPEVDIHADQKADIETQLRDRDFDAFGCVGGRPIRYVETHFAGASGFLCALRCASALLASRCIIGRL